MAGNQNDESAPRNLTRRDVIKGVIAAGAVSSAGYLFRSSVVRAQASAPGSVERLITLNVNGQQRRVDVMKQETLATTLRYKLGLTGTKLGCDRSECGACTVLIDDVPALFLLGPDPHRARQEDHDHRRPRQRRRQAASGAAGRRRRAGLPVRLLHARLRDGDGRIPQDQSQPHPRRTGPRRFRQSCRCQDYDKILTALMRGAENLRRCVTMPAAIEPKLRSDSYRIQADRQELHNSRPRREGHRQGEVRRRLSRRRHAVLPSCC